ncbi:MAG: hypothetical protein BWK80_27315 [Desulfobacteraceae bacterium IS3]|nr:MAG: hypothetical protein BWK80_27315 [Desulfobacteraceae bacterium IS3]
MLIKFKNLGKIKETELDLRPLTLIIGPNNSNKTYIAYSVYALWEQLRDTYVLFHGQKKDCFSLPIETCVNSLFAEYKKKRTIDLGNFFQDSSHKLFADTHIEFDISKQEIKENLKKKITSKNNISDNDLLLDIKEDMVYFREPSSKYLEFLTSAISESVFPFPLAMPAERNALILTYKLLSNRRYKLMKDTQREIFSKSDLDKRQLALLKEQGDIGYPKPIEDFLDFLIDVEMAKKPDAEAEFQNLADIIEQHIQNRNKLYLESLRLGGKEIKVRVKKGLDIDLHNASSAIRQLAPLLLYLRYRAKKNDFLIIDEPEMNLHPEAQAKLLEIFGMMVNAGIRILITTHSPYLLAHLNNLVHDDMKNAEAAASSLYLKDGRAFLSTEQVSAYEMKKNKLHDLKDKDFGIRWDTLSDVSADIQQKYFEIQEKKAFHTDGKSKQKQ